MRPAHDLRVATPADRTPSIPPERRDDGVEAARDEAVRCRAVGLANLVRRGGHRVHGGTDSCAQSYDRSSGEKSTSPIVRAGAAIAHRHIIARIHGQAGTALLRAPGEEGEATSVAEPEVRRGRGHVHKTHRSSHDAAYAPARQVGGDDRALTWWSAPRPPAAWLATSGPLAHRVEQGTFYPKVPGSSPGRPTGPVGVFP